MNPLKKLAGQTVIYGLSSIIGRLLNYLLVPLHTQQFSTDQYGIITEMYAYVAFLVVLLTYGMETAFFRYTNEQGVKKENVYTTAVFSLFTTTIVFIVLATGFSNPVAVWLHYPDHSEYVIWFAIIVGLDALTSIPLARLRAENKAKRFAFINISSVVVNIGLNVFFIGYCMPVYLSGETNFLTDTFYNPDIGVGYVFISNLIASCVKFLLLLPHLLKLQGKAELIILKQMLFYSLPLLIAGLAGIINETIDRILLKRLLIDALGETQTLSQLGIYGACYKISIIITLFIQAFRYAADPFFFSQAGNENSKQIYSRVMSFFVLFCAFVFLVVMLNMNIIKYFIRKEEFWQGLGVVPVLLMANICLGIYYNLSIWYKLTNKTHFGAYIAIMGAVITLALNYLWIPIWGYTGAAWATLVCYASMVIVSYLLGQKHYPVNYDLKKILMYIAVALTVYWISTLWRPLLGGWALLLNTGILLTLAFVAYKTEIKHVK